jgi:hypothetical protein
LPSCEGIALRVRRRLTFRATSAMTASKNTGVNCAKKVVRKRYEPFKNGISFMDRLRPHLTS